MFKVDVNQFVNCIITFHTKRIVFLKCRCSYTIQNKHSCNDKDLYNLISTVFMLKKAGSAFICFLSNHSF